MKSSFWNKDPTKLNCPKCDGAVDAGATFKASLKLLRKRKLVCPHCSAQLEKRRKTYWSPIALLFMLALNHASFSSPWNWLLPFISLAVYFVLVGMEIASTHLAEIQGAQDVQGSQV
ncbi:MAG TPA: hypothetical protein VJ603_00695 [Paucimonas sp.]|nr:hypothetical protein [Paucimonas sp.]